MGSVEADLEIMVVINSNTTREAEALNHLVEGLNSGKLGLNVFAIRVQGKQFKLVRSSLVRHDSFSATSYRALCFIVIV